MTSLLRSFSRLRNEWHNFNIFAFFFRVWPWLISRRRRRPSVAVAPYGLEKTRKKRRKNKTRRNRKRRKRPRPRRMTIGHATVALRRWGKLTGNRTVCGILTSIFFVCVLYHTSVLFVVLQKYRTGTLASTTTASSTLPSSSGISSSLYSTSSLNRPNSLTGLTSTYRSTRDTERGTHIRVSFHPNKKNYNYYS